MDFRNGVADARNVCSDAADARWAKSFPPSLRTVALGEKFRRYPGRDIFPPPLRTLTSGEKSKCIPCSLRRRRLEVP